MDDEQRMTRMFLELQDRIEFLELSNQHFRKINQYQRVINILIILIIWLMLYTK